MVPCNRASTWAAQFFLRAVERQVTIIFGCWSQTGAKPQLMHLPPSVTLALVVGGVHRLMSGSLKCRGSVSSWLKASLPAWLCAKATLQQDIASFEGVAQLCLLVARTMQAPLCYAVPWASV